MKTKTAYTAPACEVIDFTSEHSLMLGVSDNPEGMKGEIGGEGDQFLSNKKQGGSWNSSLWSDTDE
ncbi:MAG TPA: hypothetical protein PLN34_03690 [Alloprevotella sp.]|nr:hypothetical protein [Alloprevotella sp.]